MHNWKEITQKEYYINHGDNIIHQNLKYYMCTNCGLCSKQFVAGGNMIFHDDTIHLDNIKNSKLTCEEVIIKRIIE